MSLRRNVVNTNVSLRRNVLNTNVSLRRNAVYDVSDLRSEQLLKSHGAHVTFLYKGMLGVHKGS